MTKENRGLVRRYLALFTGLCALIVVSCATNPRLGARDARELGFGLSRNQVAEKFGHAGWLQFAALREDALYECVSYTFVLPRPYYDRDYLFVFCGDKLTSISKAGDFYHSEVVDYPETPEPFDKLEREAPWNTEDKVSAVVSASGLSVQQFVSELEEPGPRVRSSYNALPAFLLLSPILVPQGLLDASARDLRHQKWTKQFTPDKVKPGMSRAQVESVYGKPVFGMNSNTETTFAFGPVESLLRTKDGGLHLYWDERRYWVAVVFKEDKAIRILSDHLFNGLEIVRRENALPDHKLP
ncbi:MAG: hypothetical protein HY706_08725 [Candidatus Hydrogenedentes bacterium]|nr:hypothetical protein [Candidatus Hydrogenedentota bacterium]